MERIDRPREEVRWRRPQGRPAERLRLGVADWLAPFKEESPYPGIAATRQRFSEDFFPRLLVILAVAVFAVSFGMATLQRFAAFQHPGFDLGIFDQGIWLLSRFKDPFVTIMGVDLFGDHSSYILLLFVPLYWISPSPQWLLLAQALALAVAAIPVYLLARRFVHNSWLAAVVAFSFLFTPALGWLDLENFHPDSFEVPLALFAFYLLYERRWRPYFVTIALLLLVKEDAAFLVVPLGVYAAVRHDRRVGFVTAGVGVAWFLLAVFVLQPHFSGGAPGSLDAFRIPYGGWRGLFTAALERPWDVFAGALTSDKIKYVVQLLAPFAFLPLLSVESLVALPTLLFNLLSTFSYQHDIRYHYTSLIIPVFAWAALLRVRRARTRGSQRALIAFLVLAGAFSAYLWGPVDWSRQPGAQYDPQHPEVRALAEAVALVPPDAVVASRSRISTHLAHREKVYDFPTPFYAVYYGDSSMDHRRLPAADEVQYVLETPARLTGEAARAFKALRENGGFTTVFEKEGVVVLRKEPGSATLGGGVVAAAIYN